jgi:flavin-binding protein dodecin
MFNNASIPAGKLEVLESKLNIYESLSKEMLEKLESAVEKISESNNRIALILAKHDERIDQNAKSDELIIKMVEEVKTSNTSEHKAVINRLEKLEKTVDDLLKFRWQAAAIVGAAILVVGAVIPFLDNLMPNHYNRGGSQTSLVHELH